MHRETVSPTHQTPTRGRSASLARAALVPAAVATTSVLAACAPPAVATPPARAAAQDTGTAARVARIEHAIVRRTAAGADSGPPTTLAARMAELRVPGVQVAVFDSGRIVWARGYGVRDATTGAPVDTLTLFQAASISKPVAAAGMLRLVESGRAELDADVNTMLRSWRVPPSPYTAAEKVTLRRITSHTAGLTVHGFAGYRVGAPLPSLVQLLDGRPPANSPPVRVDTTPGARERYSGGGTEVMRLLMEDVTGTPFAALMDTLVLRPAGMAHSTFAQPLPARLAGRAASAHGGDGRPVPGRSHVYPELAAAGLWTTAPDLARFLLAVGRAYRGEPGGFPDPASAREMLTRAPGAAGGVGFRLAGAGPTLRYRHGGGNEGFRGYAVAFGAGGRGAVVLTNADRGSELFPELLDVIAREYHWPAPAMGSP
jgi:CubicO group peptidase (beta-lactamase class C family)